MHGDEQLDLKAAANFSTSWADISFKTIGDLTATNWATFQLPEKQLSWYKLHVYHTAIIRGKLREYRIH